MNDMLDRLLRSSIIILLSATLFACSSAKPAKTGAPKVEIKASTSGYVTATQIPVIRVEIKNVGNTAVIVPQYQGRLWANVVLKAKEYEVEVVTKRHKELLRVTVPLDKKELNPGGTAEYFLDVNDDYVPFYEDGDKAWLKRLEEAHPLEGLVQLFIQGEVVRSNQVQLRP